MKGTVHMKKSLFTLLLLLTLLATTAGSAFAGSVVELVGVNNNRSGPSFTFRVSGEFSQSELESGFVKVEGGDSYQLHCAQQDETTVVCHVSKKAGGQNVVVSFGGSKFWTVVPEEKVRQYCYNVYEPLTKEEYDAGYWQWMNRGVHCQDEPAVNGNDYYGSSPAFPFDNWYIFSEDGIDDFPCGPSGSCGGYDHNWSNPGEGYYLAIMA